MEQIAKPGILTGISMMPILPGLPRRGTQTRTWRPRCAAPAASGRTCGKRIVEALTNRSYWMELENAPGQRAWAYRKAAWAIEDLGLIYRQMGPARPRGWRASRMWGRNWRR